MKTPPITILAAFFLLTIFSATPRVATADTITDLKAKIEDRAREIQKIEQEIGEYQRQIQETGNQAKTLQDAIKILDITRKKLLADLNLTKNKLSITQLTIVELQNEINIKEEKIKLNREVVADSLREIQYSDSISLIESLLAYKDVGELWNRVEVLHQFRNAVSSRIAELKNLGIELKDKKAESEQKKNKLSGLTVELADRKKIVERNQTDKENLLTQTKSTEANYRKILAQKQAVRDAFQKELLQFESQLKFAIDPKSFPSAGNHVLNWPLPQHIITQPFGETEFSRTTAAYNGQGHNGIDLKASIGTEVMAAAGGIVAGVGNTDTVCPNASYGKWILLKHNNGLSTLYAHLSLIKVQSGQAVQTGNIIGYSGSTGYATGPHLHFTVYATEGLRIVERRSVICGGKIYTMPVADLKAYLNPVDYLPNA